MRTNQSLQHRVTWLSALTLVLATATTACEVSFGETDADAGTGGSYGSYGGAAGSTGVGGATADSGTASFAGGAGTPGTGGSAGAQSDAGTQSDAGGSVCVPGSCASLTLADGLVEPTRVVVDTDVVYFTDRRKGGRLLSVGKTGANPVTMLEQPLSANVL